MSLPQAELLWAQGPATPYCPFYMGESVAESEKDWCKSLPLLEKQLQMCPMLRRPGCYMKN